MLEITLSGQLDNGMILDAADLDVCVAPVIARIDHHDLNELGRGEGPIARLAQPTVENLALYFSEALVFLGNDGRFKLERVRVHETDRLFAEVAT
jgi:6-pyruvoyl-tetrahydropterin synthase